MHVDVQATSSAASLPQLTHSAAGTGLALAESLRFVFSRLLQSLKNRTETMVVLQFVL